MLISGELNPDTPYPIIDLMRGQIDVEDLGGIETGALSF